MMRPMAIGSLLVCVLFGVTTAAPKHPASGHPLAGDLSVLYHADQDMADISNGDIVFSRGRTPISELTPEEGYMLAGVKSSDLPDKRPLLSWVSTMFAFYSNYYLQYGEMPKVADPPTIRKVKQFRNIDDAQ